MRRCRFRWDPTARIVFRLFTRICGEVKYQSFRYSVRSLCLALAEWDSAEKQRNKG